MNREKVINFLRPNWRKIYVWIIVSIIIVLTIFIRNIFVPIPLGPLSITYGYPLPFYSAGGFRQAYWIALFEPFLWINLFIGYIVSCLIIYFYNKFKPLNKKFKQ